MVSPTSKSWIVVFRITLKLKLVSFRMASMSGSIGSLSKLKLLKENAERKQYL